MHDVVCAVNASLTDADDVIPVMLFPESTGRLVREVHRHLEAYERGLKGTSASSAFLRARPLNEGPLSNIGNLPSPTAKSRARMERLRGIAAGVIDKDQFTTRTAIYELTLAALPLALLRPQGDESPADAPTCVISGRDTRRVGNRKTTSPRCHLLRLQKLPPIPRLRGQGGRKDNHC